MTYDQFIQDAFDKLFSKYLWQFKRLEFGLQAIPYLTQEDVNKLFVVCPKTLVYKLAEGADDFCNYYGIWKNNAPTTFKEVEFLLDYSAEWRDRVAPEFHVEMNNLARKVNLKLYSIEYLEDVFQNSKGAKYGSKLGGVTNQFLGNYSSLGSIIGGILGGILYLPFETPTKKALIDFMDWYLMEVDKVNYMIVEIFNNNISAAIQKEFLFDH